MTLLVAPKKLVKCQGLLAFAPTIGPRKKTKNHPHLSISVDNIWDNFRTHGEGARPHNSKQWRHAGVLFSLNSRWTFIHLAFGRPAQTPACKPLPASVSDRNRKTKRKIKMNLKQQLKDKNLFLRKAYEAAYEYAPSSPLSVSLDPREFGNSIGFDETQTERIMMELVADGYVQSSLGMGMLLVTRLGLEYLTEIEDEPLTASADNERILTATSNPTFMKQSEKLDLILRELYKYKNDGKYYLIGWICQTLNIPVDSFLELNKLAHRLKDDGFITPLFTHNDCSAELTSYGIEYCEENSYTYSGHSIITNNYSISIVNSPNSNIVNQSNNFSISQNISEASQAVEKIRESVSIDTTIDKEKAAEILECLNEIQDNLRNNQKPKFAIKSLIDLAGGISSISSWVTTLGQFAGIIPIPGL